MTSTLLPRFVRAVPAFVSAAAAICISLPAFAQSRAAPEEPGRIRARTVAGEGDAQFAAGRCDRAIRLWKDANKIFPAPTIELRVAHCQALLGHVVAASATLDAIVGTSLSPDAPEAFVTAKGQAQSELPALKARIATLVLEKRTPQGVNIDSVSVDDETLPVDRDPAGRYPIDPGKHRIRIQQGKETWEDTIEIEDGEVRTMVVSSALEQPPPRAKPGRTGAFVVGGVGVALAAVGAAFGVMASGDSKSLTRDCTSDRTSCAPDDKSRIDSLKTKALLSDLFIGGGVLALGVSGFLFWRSTQVEKDPPRLRLTVTGSAMLLQGRF